MEERAARLSGSTANQSGRSATALDGRPAASGPGAAVAGPAGVVAEGQARFEPAVHVPGARLPTAPPAAAAAAATAAVQPPTPLSLEEPTVDRPGSNLSEPESVEGDGVEADSEPDVVLLTLPANSVYLSVLRTATAGLAARLHFTLDEIEDLRIAVDEACAMLLAGEELPDAELHCRFTLSADQIAVTVTLPGVERALPPQDTFAWQVLTALTGEVDAQVSEGQLSLGLVKRRSRAQ